MLINMATTNILPGEQSTTRTTSLLVEPLRYMFLKLSAALEFLETFSTLKIVQYHLAVLLIVVGS